MLDVEQEPNTKHGVNEQSTLFEEYNDIVENLKRELHQCKVEQNNIRTELIRLQNENQGTNDVREAFNHIHLEECGKQDFHKEELTNLQERISALESERDSALQLWHLSLNTISSLEQQLKANIVDGKGAKFYQEQTNNVKAIYSEAIKALEGKLSQAKENFLKQQALCQTNKERLDDVTRERNNIMQKYTELQKEVQDKDRKSLVEIETLQKELSYARAETKKVMQVKLELEKKLEEVRKFAENVVEKDKETKMKMAEALELVETAVREKDVVLHREAFILEEKARLEIRLNTIASEYDAKIQELNNRTKDEHERSMKMYLSEITDLKAELREKTVMLDKVERDLKLAQEEHQRICRDLEDALRKSNAKIFDCEQKMKQMKLELEARVQSKHQNKHDSEMRYLKQKIAVLEDKLIASNDKLKQVEYQASTTAENQARKTDRKNTDVLEQYINLESQLAKTFGDKEDLVLQLKSLKRDFDYEIQKRDNDRQLLESRIRELEVNLQRASYMKETKSDNIVNDSQLRDKNEKRTFDIVVENKCHCCESALSEHINKLKEKYDKKTKELKHHVQVHQKLSKRWRDEAKSLATKFQGKTKELRLRINMLQREKSDLSKELLVCKQELAQYKMQDIQRYNSAHDIR